MFKKIKFKIPLPQNSVVYAEKGDIAKDLLLYEVDQLEVLEEVDYSDASHVNFSVKDGQFVKKGDVIFTEGLLGHKAMVADFNGIIEIGKNKCRILGQKRHIERRINLDASVERVVPNKFVELRCKVLKFDTVFYTNYKVKLSKQIYIKDKSSINQSLFDLGDRETTYFINDNLYVEEIAKLIAFGAKRLVVNGISIENIKKFHEEISKLDAFCILSGYGEFLSKINKNIEESRDIIWGKKQLYFSEKLEKEKVMVFEHPFWGMSGDYEKKNELIGELNYNRETIEFYLKNLEEIND